MDDDYYDRDDFSYEGSAQIEDGDGDYPEIDSDPGFVVNSPFEDDPWYEDPWYEESTDFDNDSQPEIDLDFVDNDPLEDEFNFVDYSDFGDYSNYPGNSLSVNGVSNNSQYDGIPQFADFNSVGFTSANAANHSFKINAEAPKCDAALAPALDFKCFLDSEDYSDIKIIVSGKAIPCHKIILSKHSPVFDAMFKTDMRERRENIIKIDDIKYEVFFEALRFIYCGETNRLECIAKDLIGVADKYQIDSLKTLCVESLLNQITLATASELLKLASTYRVEKLKDKVLSFVFETRGKFTQSQLKSLDSRDQVLYAELLKKIKRI